MEVPKGSTVSDLLRLLWERGAPFDRLPASPVVAVNRDFASPQTRLAEGDEIAFIPPVSGG